MLLPGTERALLHRLASAQRAGRAPSMAGAVVRGGHKAWSHAIKTTRNARFRPVDDGTWIGLNGYFAGETLQPVRDSSGRLTHLDIGSFVFTRGPYDPDATIPGGVDVDGWRPG